MIKRSTWFGINLNYVTCILNVHCQYLIDIALSYCIAGRNGSGPAFRHSATKSQSSKKFLSDGPKNKKIKKTAGIRNAFSLGNCEIFFRRRHRLLLRRVFLQSVLFTDCTDQFRKFFRMKGCNKSIHICWDWLFKEMCNMFLFTWFMTRVLW